MSIHEDSDYEDKYVVALKFVNKILENIGKEKIDKLEDFEIDRDDLAKEANNQFVKEMNKEIFGPFDKNECKYYKRHQIGTYCVTLLRRMMKCIGYEMDIKKRNKSIEFEGYVYNRTQYLYTITKK